MGLRDPNEITVKQRVSEMTSDHVSEKLAQLSDTASRDLLKEIALEVKTLDKMRGERFKTLLMHIWLEDV